MTELDHDPAALDNLAALGGASLVLRVLQTLAELLERLPKELREASAAPSPELLQRRAHSILSASGYAGETNLRAAAHAIEHAVRSGDLAASSALLDQFDRAAEAAMPRIIAAISAWKYRA